MSSEEYVVLPEETKEACKQDMDVFGMVAAPDDVSLEFPELFKQLWFMLAAAVGTIGDFSKFAVGLPRGHGKTFVVKLFLLYCILFTNKKFILVVGSTVDLAQNIIADIVDMLDSDNIRTLFGNWRFSLEVDRQGFKKFIFNGRPVILKASGAGSSIRGITVKNKRPDIIVFDDAQTADCAQSLVEAQKFITWFTGTAMKAKNPTGCTFIYIGNMYKDVEIKKGLYTCMLRNLQLNSSWTSFIVGGITVDGKALWEELQPLEQLLEELQQDQQLDQEETFYAEVLNDPAAISKRLLNTAALTPFDPLPEDRPHASFILIDPSSGKKSRVRLDDTAIGYFEVHDGIPVLQDLTSERLSPLATIHTCLKICMATGCSTIICESVAYQSTLLFWFEHVCTQLGIEGIKLLEIGPRGKSKTSRILDFFKAWEQGQLLVCSKHHSTVVGQATRFNPIVSDNIDDILDIMAYAPQVMFEYPHEILVDLENTWEQEPDTSLLADPNRDLHDYDSSSDDYIEQY